MTIQTPIRERGFVNLGTTARPLGHGWSCASARGKRFSVDWITAGRGASPRLSAKIEAIIILPDRPARILHGDGTVEAPARSAVLCPAGSVEVEAADGTGFAIIQPIEGNAPTTAINDSDYGPDDENILPLPVPSRRLAKGPVAIRASEIIAPADKPRLKILRGAMLSISWIEYEGSRSRTSLSPHSHPDFEQGSLALSGRFIHHLRTPWGEDADAWRADEHLEVPSPSLCIIPPNIIHTTEGPYDEPHLLIDIFAPPRADFLAKGWISNAADFHDS